MKFLIILVGFVILVVRADYELEMTKLNLASKDCEKELGEPKNLRQKLKKGQDIGDKEKAGKMALCFNTKLGHMLPNGETDPELLEQHVNNLTEKKDKRQKMIKECGPKNGKTPGEAALNFVKCMQKYI